MVLYLIRFCPEYLCSAAAAKDVGLAAHRGRPSSVPAPCAAFPRSPTPPLALPSPLPFLPCDAPARAGARGAVPRGGAPAASRRRDPRSRRRLRLRAIYTARASGVVEKHTALAPTSTLGPSPLTPSSTTSLPLPLPRTHFHHARALSPHALASVAVRYPRLWHVPRPAAKAPSPAAGPGVHRPLCRVALYP
ncbi:hypothetical protein HYPSUDRAFT_199910 [Hypholoma sublateritium FD-334 SS-4]|uniref:Uncharacterized protein n=1 Tax=Hypholoma sublateritium (strain FD-334 SS-4) TaxID=945553 RepID=A0A0D2MN60_HYPSF|nr:hypothetical protein HYPSUDRAFT_199910 [Hypholoma sublateritium FD-334 SS-4]